VLPVVPELINHLGEEICQKINLIVLPCLTPWCIINKGSVEMSALQMSGYAH
jgi:hypothetical protein